MIWLIGEGKPDPARNILRFSLRHHPLSEAMQEKTEGLHDTLPLTVTFYPAAETSAKVTVRSPEEVVNALDTNIVYWPNSAIHRPRLPLR